MNQGRFVDAPMTKLVGRWYSDCLSHHRQRQRQLPVDFSSSSFQSQWISVNPTVRRRQLLFAACSYDTVWWTLYTQYIIFWCRERKSFHIHFSNPSLKFDLNLVVIGVVSLLWTKNSSFPVQLFCSHFNLRRTKEPQKWIAKGVTMQFIKITLAFKYCAI